MGVSEVLCRGEEGRKGWVLVRCYAGGRKAEGVGVSEVLCRGRKAGRGGC